MGLEFRNGKRYLYKKLRKGRKVVSEYVCGGQLAWVLDDLQEHERQLMKEANKAIRKEQALQLQSDKKLYELEKSLKEILTNVAINNGYHKLNGQWRKKRQI